jgi:hypothetical protein
MLERVLCKSMKIIPIVFGRKLVGTPVPYRSTACECYDPRCSCFDSTFAATFVSGLLPPASNFPHFSFLVPLDKEQ